MLEAFQQNSLQSDQTQSSTQQSMHISHGKLKTNSFIIIPKVTVQEYWCLHSLVRKISSSRKKHLTAANDPTIFPSMENTEAFYIFRMIWKRCYLFYSEVSLLFLIGCKSVLLIGNKHLSKWRRNKCLWYAKDSKKRRTFALVKSSLFKGRCH